jgi:hypothetical protein
MPDKPRKTSHKSMKDSLMRPFDENESGMTSTVLREGMERFAQDLDWYYSNRTMLRKKYIDRWVAVKDRKVVMADRTHDRLLKRLKARPGGRAGAQVFFVSTSEDTMVY